MCFLGVCVRLYMYCLPFIVSLIHLVIYVCRVNFLLSCAKRTGTASLLSLTPIWKLYWLIQFFSSWPISELTKQFELHVLCQKFFELFWTESKPEYTCKMFLAKKEMEMQDIFIRKTHHHNSTKVSDRDPGEPPQDPDPDEEGDRSRAPGGGTEARGQGHAALCKHCK